MASNEMVAATWRASDHPSGQRVLGVQRRRQVLQRRAESGRAGGGFRGAHQVIQGRGMGSDGLTEALYGSAIIG